MASISLENQLQSAQNNLLFLQQDHANTLKGLHAEIRRLQQHCTDLTYELMVKSSDPADGGEARCAELRRRCEELEMQLKAKEEENTELMRELEQKTAMISVLENTIKEREKKYLEELKLKSHRLAVLSGELEQRAGTIAYLTAQLHATKKRLLSGGSSEGSPGGSPAASYKPAPPPPREQQPDTPRRRMRKSLSQPLHADYAELCRVGADGRRLALRDALDAMPDPTPFLQARELAAEASLPRERPAVIPPIPPISRERSPAPPDPASPRHGLSQQPRAHVGVAHRIHRSAPPTAAQPELQTLAVDQVNDGKVARKESGTDRTV